jgi:hypothetical protein
MKIKMVGLFLLLLMLAGCGTSSKHPTKHISIEEVNVALAKQTIAIGVIRCIHDEQHNGDTGKALGEISEKEGSEVDHAARELIEDFRKNQATRTDLAEEAESLQSCWPWLTKEIRTVLTYG